MPKILLVDDEEPIRALFKRALERDGHSVALAADGAEALAQLGAAGFDLMLSDIRMPVMDGIALAIEAKTRHPGMLILLMTGYAEQRERAEELRDVVEDVLSKPFSVAELRSAVQRTLSLPASG
jgi:two-component system cell cycle response regulator CpdR